MNNPSGVTARLKIKVVPGASRTGISGWLGDSLKVRVSQPPEKGKANAAVEAMLCRALDLPTGSVKVVSGRTSQHKIIEITGLGDAEVRRQLGSG